jgi:hypothetical protein
MATMMDHALAYAKRGFPVFPCDSNKEPIGSLAPNGVLDATTDPKKIERWWSRSPRANIGFDVTGANLVVVDFDPGSDFDQTVRDLSLPKTELRQRTPRGGVHLFYSIDEGERIANSSGKIAEAVDVRGLNGYVLLPPSRTKDGEYEWQAEGRATHRTEGMVHAFNVAREKHKDRDHWLIDPDLPENVEAAVKWLKEEAKIAVEGKGGDHIAYATAAHMKSFGLSPELAFDLMWEHWNPRCDPPWGAEEVEHFATKIENGYSYNTSPPGNITKAYKDARIKEVFKPIVREDIPSGRELLAGKFRFADREALNHVPPASWLIPDTIPDEGYVVLFGPPGSFKSFLAIDWGATVATGGDYPWSGAWTVARPGPVLYALGEGRPGFTARLRAWEKAHYGGRQIPNFIVCDPVPLVQDELDGFIDAALQLHPEGYRLVFVDTAARALQGLNENAQEHASKLTAMVQKLQTALGCAVVVIHHSGHGDETRAKGSQEFYGAPDAVFRIQREGKTKKFLLFNQKQKDAPEWEKPRAMEMRDVGTTQDSIAVFPSGAAKEAEPKTDDGEADRKRAKNFDAAAVLVLDTVIAAILGENKLKSWSTREIAQAVAMDGRVDVDSKTLQNTHLIRLRETKGSKANRMYSPQTKKWKWRD